MIVPNSSLTLLTPSPPLSGAPPTSHTLSLSPFVCRLAHDHTGVFHNNFLWYKLLALIFAINPFLPFFPTLLFPVHFTQYLLPKKRTLFFAGKQSEKSFSRSFHCCIFTFWWTMPIIYFEGIKPPCNSTETQSLVLQGKGRWMTISNNSLQLSHRLLQLQTFEII